MSELLDKVKENLMLPPLGGRCTYRAAHERRKEIDAILKRTEQEIAEGKIQYTPWRECISEVLSKRDKA